MNLIWFNLIWNNLIWNNLIWFSYTSFDLIQFEICLVYIKREEGEEEVLCTTLPVVVATAAAVIFLQLCILVTCILCIYTARRGRKTDRQVDRQSLHSGRSSTTPLPPPLHTLYHDNLTYRYFFLRFLHILFSQGQIWQNVSKSLKKDLF